MSSLWTPYGERQPEPGASQPAGTAPGGDSGRPSHEPGQDEVSEDEMREAMARLAQTPVRDIVANHAIGLWELAVLHLGLGGAAQVNLDEAKLAIDAMAALVDGVGDRLGEHASPLREALSQLQVAYVQIKEAVANATAAQATGQGGPSSGSGTAPAPPSDPGV